MNEALEPSTGARICARVLGIIQLILLGPLTLASTFISSLLCCSCIVAKIRMENPSFEIMRTWFSTCMSGWGMFWMIVLFFLPLVLVAGGGAAGVLLVLLVITYPCYAFNR